MSKYMVMFGVMLGIASPMLLANEVSGDSGWQQTEAAAVQAAHDDATAKCPSGNVTFHDDRKVCSNDNNGRVSCTIPAECHSSK